MVNSIWEDIKQQYRNGNMVTKIILWNLGVFLVTFLLYVSLKIGNGWVLPPVYQKVIYFFSISNDWRHNLTHPYVIITHMFFHAGFMHVLFNMLLFYYFGRIVGDFIGNHRILPLYLLGGLAGAIMYFVTINTLGYGGGGIHYAYGASAAVMATVIAAGTLSPDYLMNLILLGPVKIKYIVAVLFLIDLGGVASDANTGGHFAHLGGALFGWFFIWQLRKGKDWSIPVNQLLSKIQTIPSLLSGSGKRPRPTMVYKKDPNTPKSKPKTTPTSHTDNKSHQAKVDAILEKIKADGYESLTQEEKEFLFRASKK